MAKRTQPQRGIIYTFRFRNKKGTHFTNLLYEGITDKGRLLFYNYESKAYTTMPRERFSYIHRFNLVREVPVKLEIKEVSPKCIIENTIINSFEITQEEQKILSEIRDLTEEERVKVRFAIERDSNDLLKDLEFCFASEETNLDRSILNKAMNDLIKVQTILNKRLVNI